ncbi:hypothetical protein NL676_035072 [Syzygium grande]|nr:hypothetical protein NL676_035072 [Syzygium grande]
MCAPIQLLSDGTTGSPAADFALAVLFSSTGGRSGLTALAPPDLSPADLEDLLSRCILEIESGVKQIVSEYSDVNGLGREDLVSGVYLAERLNKFLGDNWKSFATQNYFDPHGLFLSTLWSGPLLVVAIVILVEKG